MMMIPILIASAGRTTTGDDVLLKASWMHFSGEQSPHVAYLTWLLYLLTNTHTTLIPGVVLRTGQI